MRQRLGQISTQIKYIKIRADGMKMRSMMYAGDNLKSYNERALYEDICILVDQIRQLTWEVTNNTADEDAIYQEIASCVMLGHNDKGKAILRQFRDDAMERIDIDRQKELPNPPDNLTAWRG